MLKFEHVTKVYGGKKALNDLTLSFLPGHVYALVGPNGSGKSTMMKVAAGLVKPNSGSATYQEMPIGVESKKHIAYMCTEPFYYDYMKIQDVKQFYADFFADFDKERFELPAPVHAANTGYEGSLSVLRYGCQAKNCRNTGKKC